MEVQPKAEMQKCTYCQRFKDKILKEGCPTYQVTPHVCPFKEVLDEYYKKPILGEKTDYSFSLGTKVKPKVIDK